MPLIPAPKDQWYVVHVLSGQENKVRNSFERRIESEEMSDVIFEVLLPTERVSEVKKGKRSESKRKFFPGYLIMNMHLLNDEGGLVDRSWYFVQETHGVIGFAGTKNNPIPMRPREVESMLLQIKEREESIKPRIAFDVGETIKVADGPFERQPGVIEEIDREKGTLLVSVTVFGRPTPVELEHWQIEKEE